MTPADRAARLLENKLGGHRWGAPEVAVHAFALAGLLDADTADRWARAFARTRTMGDVPFDGALAAAAEPELARRLDELVPERIGGWGNDASVRFGGAIAMAEAVGALDAAARERWSRAQIDRVYPLTDDTPVATVSFGGYEPGDLDALEDVEPITHPAPAVLERITLGPPERRDGARLTTILHYDTSTTVRWHVVRDQPGPMHPGATFPLEPEFVLALADDVGTDYGPAERGSSSGHGDPDVIVINGETHFAAPIPPEARELRLTWGGGTSTCDPLA